MTAPAAQLKPPGGEIGQGDGHWRFDRKRWFEFEQRWCLAFVYATSSCLGALAVRQRAEDWRWVGWTLRHENPLPQSERDWAD